MASQVPSFVGFVRCWGVERGARRPRDGGRRAARRRLYCRGAAGGVQRDSSPPRADGFFAPRAVPQAVSKGASLVVQRGRTRLSSARAGEGSTAKDQDSPVTHKGEEPVISAHSSYIGRNSPAAPFLNYLPQKPKPLPCSGSGSVDPSRSRERDRGRGPKHSNLEPSH